MKFSIDRIFTDRWKLDHTILLLAFLTVASVISGLCLCITLVVDPQYYIELNNTDINATAVYRADIYNILKKDQPDLTPSSTLPQYGLNATTLSPYYRLGLHKYCEGQYKDEVWLQGACFHWDTGHVGIDDIYNNRNWDDRTRYGYLVSYFRDSTAFSRKIVFGMFIAALAVFGLVLSYLVFILLWIDSLKLTKTIYSSIGTVVFISLILANCLQLAFVVGMLQTKVIRRVRYMEPQSHISGELNNNLTVRCSVTLTLAILATVLFLIVSRKFKRLNRTDSPMASDDVTNNSVESQVVDTEPAKEFTESEAPPAYTE